MQEGLKPHNYRQWFQTMLWIEEMQMELDIRFYSMEDAVLKRVPMQTYSASECLELRVSGCGGGGGGVGDECVGRVCEEDAYKVCVEEDVKMYYLVCGRVCEGGCISVCKV